MFSHFLVKFYVFSDSRPNLVHTDIFYTKGSKLAKRFKNEAITIKNSHRQSQAAEKAKVLKNDLFRIPLLGKHTSSL